ncbi:ATP phosphoribosyltransferase regulatory subunit [Thermaerobacter litoralis]
MEPAASTAPSTWWPPAPAWPGGGAGAGAGDRAEEARRQLAALFGRWGYRRVRTPFWEEAREDLLDVFPETALCRFVDPAGRVLALRPDHTVAVARWAAPRLAGGDPWRLYYLDPVFRRDPRDGRFQAVTQAGVELLGAPAPAGDVEVLGLLVEALEAVGGLWGDLASPLADPPAPPPDPGSLGDGAVALAWPWRGSPAPSVGSGSGLVPFPVRVAVGHTGVLQAFLAASGLDEPAAAAVTAALARRDRVALRRALEAGLGPDRAQEAYRFLAGSFPVSEALEHLEALGVEPAAELAATLRAACRFFPGAAGALRVEPGLVRDLEYYTGLVVEVFAGWRRIAAGGRYDGLLARFGGRGPAVGLAFDLEALVEAAGAATAPGVAGGAGVAGAAGFAEVAGSAQAGGPAAAPVAGGIGAVPHPGWPGRAAVDYLVAGPATAADPQRLWQEARRLRAQGASAVVMAEPATEDEALAAARRLGCLRLLWLDGRRRVLRMAWPPGR